MINANFYAIKNKLFFFSQYSRKLKKNVYLCKVLINKTNYNGLHNGF